LVPMDCPEAALDMTVNFVEKYKNWLIYLLTFSDKIFIMTCKFFRINFGKNLYVYIE
jgi:hypothetical protein